jgi:pyruvate/2-oxoglutarate dehydrogenase complex dihydrolipoamide acyltransferase (E2) component
MGMQDATIVRWLKSVGDELVEGEDLVEIESAKVNEVIKAPVAGALTRLAAAQGQVVGVGAVLAEIEERS